MSRTTRSPHALFAWPQAMAFAFGRAGIAPDVFWRMTPRELEAAIAGYAPPAAGPNPIDRAGLDRLRRRFPDRDE